MNSSLQKILDKKDEDDSFNTQRKLTETLNLYYVACTRSLNTLSNAEYL